MPAPKHSPKHRPEMFAAPTGKSLEVTSDPLTPEFDSLTPERNDRARVKKADNWSQIAHMESA